MGTAPDQAIGQTAPSGQTPPPGQTPPSGRPRLSGDGRPRPAEAGRAALLRVRIATRVAALGVTGASTAFLVARDGGPGWRLTRLLLVLLVTGVALVGLRSGSRWWRGVAGFGVGVVAVAIGAGIGLPHASKTGWSALTLAGLACLGGGVVLAAGGFAAFWQASGRWPRVVVVPTLLACLYIVLWSLGQAIAATNVPATPLGAATPADRGLTYAEVAFPTADGVVLSGWYTRPDANGAAVVLLPGAGSTRSAVLDQAVVLARHGFGVLLFDPRGHGRSSGRAMDFGWYGDLDVTAAVSFLSERDEVDPARIGAVGLSMGGEEVVGASASDPRIKAVVAEGATSRMAADKAWLHRTFGAQGWVQERIEQLTYGAADLLTGADPPRSLRAAVQAAAPRPVLLIAAGKVPDEAHADRYIAAGSPSTVSVWEVPGAGHTAGLATQPAQWEAHVTGFLAQALVTQH